MFAKLALLFGVPCFVFGLVAFFNTEGNLAFLINGLFWIFLSALSAIIDFLRHYKLKKNKRVGDCYEIDITEILSIPLVRIGNYNTAKIEGIYINKIGEKCMVKSGYYVLEHSDKKDNLFAKIYVNTTIPTNYSIELWIGYTKLDKKVLDMIK